MTLRDTLKQLLQAAQQFEMKTPKYRRIESERQILREAITNAQLILSVQKRPQEKQKTAAPSLQRAHHAHRSPVYSLPIGRVDCIIGAREEIDNRLPLFIGPKSMSYQIRCDDKVLQDVDMHFMFEPLASPKESA